MRIFPTKSKKASPRSVGTPIRYHGGPVMTNPIIYVIWYGNWTGNNATTIIEKFLRDLGSTAWWNITREYNYTAPIVFGSSITDYYSKGTYLSRWGIETLIYRVTDDGSLPRDTNGIYLVLASADVSAWSFCTWYCGWHTYSVWYDLKYSFVGNPEQCPSLCSFQMVTPNDNFAADSMITVIAHELAEAVTDPRLDAWYDSNCDENADKCAWMFQPMDVLPNGAYYNMVINDTKYLVQENWRLSTQDCGMSLNTID
ncbi:unnamed protein product [Rotaria sp. Silwood2]|nr:unnamed protein product [Rotaria sp. Silwood2]